MEQAKTSARSSRVIKTGNKDIFMSIKPEHITNIAAGAKNHEFRRYRLPSSVRRIWFYTTAPISSIEYVARISPAKIAGEVQEDGGIGNADFNAGKKVSKYAYEILGLWKLKETLSLKLATSKGFLKGAPQKYCWVPLAFLESYPVNRQDHFFSKAPEDQKSETKKDSGLGEPEVGLGSTRRGEITDFFSYSGQKG